MKFLSAALMFTAALLPSLVNADGAAILAAEQEIAETTLSFNETVAGWDGELLTVFKILAESTQLLAVINKATGVAESSANLTSEETLALAGPTQTLVSDVTSTLSTVTAKKPVFQRTLTQLVALANLKLEKSASDKFGKAVVAKVPPALQAIAASLIAPLDPAFDAAIAEFESL